MSLFSKKHPDTPARRHYRADNPERATDASLDQRYNFKRNRTLTGSASSQVSTVGEAHAQLKSDRVRSHDLVRHRRRILVILAGVVVGGAALLSLILQFSAHATVTSRDTSLKLDATYAGIIDDYYKSQPIERLRFMLDEDHLTRYVQSVAPEVMVIQSAGSAGFGESQFILTMRRPIAGWNIGNTQQYVDAEGIAFSRNYFTPPAVQIVDKSGVQAVVGTAVASNQFLSFVGRVVGLSADRRLNVTEVVIPEGTARQIELRLENIGYPIKLSVDRPAGEQVEDMDRSLSWLVSRGLSPQYLDVRTSGRAFYL